MRGPRARTTGFILALVLMVSCGWRGSWTGERGSGSAEVGGISAASPSADDAVEEPNSDSKEEGRLSPDISQGVGEPNRNTSAGQIPLEVVIAECLERTKPAKATIKTAPTAMIGAAATYSDGEAHGNFWLGVADANGVFEVAWVVPLQAPLGPGKFLVGVQTETEGGRTLAKPFELADPGDCP